VQFAEVLVFSCDLASVPACSTTAHHQNLVLHAYSTQYSIMFTISYHFITCYYEEQASEGKPKQKEKKKRMERTADRVQAVVARPISRQWQRMASQDTKKEPAQHTNGDCTRWQWQADMSICMLLGMLRDLKDPMEGIEPVGVEPDMGMSMPVPWGISRVVLESQGSQSVV